MLVDKEICICCNKTGKILLDSVIKHLIKHNKVDLIIRDDDIPTDWRSSNYSVFRLLNIIQKRSFIKKKSDILCDYIYEKKYDFFFCFGYYQLDSSIIKIIKKNNPKCETVIYFYDSFCRLDFSNDIEKFDVCFSYDRMDAHNFSIHYLPFFCEDYPQTLDVEYDLCHIGAWSPGHVYRVPVLYNLKKQNPNLHCYFRCTWINLGKIGITRRVKYVINSIFNREYRLYWFFYKKYKDSGILSNDRILYSSILNIESKSKCIVEINSHRAGLSPRVINALANNKKIIINNPLIQEEIFYNAKNIYIIDEKEPTFDVNFLEEETIPFDFSDLKIENWLSIIFEKKNNRFDVL